MKYLALGLLLLCAACQKTEVDTEAPTMEILSLSHPLQAINICGSVEENGIFLDSDESLRMRLRFRDEQELGQYKVDIHQNFDCHGHRSPSYSGRSWTVLEIGDLEGQEQEKELLLSPPEDVNAGSYHFQIMVLDAAGNELQEADFYTIMLRNVRDTVAPSLQLNSPTEGSRLSLSAGQQMQVSASVSDNLDLSGGRMELVYYSLSGNRILAQTELFGEGTGTSKQLSSSFSIPSTLPSGVYDFELLVYDALRNEAFATWQVEL